MLNTNIQSVSITGFNKRLDNVKKTQKLFTKVEHYWNYIFINDTYYLVDPTLAGWFLLWDLFSKTVYRFK